MDEYIDRALAIHCSIYGFAQDETRPCDISEAQAAIAALPAEKVRDDVRGEWLRTDAYPHRVYCSHCYGTYLYNEKHAEQMNIPLYPNYCSNCGAWMKGGK